MNTSSSQAQPYVTEYRVAHGFNGISLSQDVNELLAKGFIVYGPLTVKGADGLFQAMIKLDERLAKVTEAALQQILAAQ